jgi:hypothetical protein
VLLRVSDDHADSLVAHLADQGFPARHLGGGEVDVLFPGSPSLFPLAAELDEWVARTGGEARVRIEPPQGGRLAAAAA